jgi:hypothetical protein
MMPLFPCAVIRATKFCCVSLMALSAIKGDTSEDDEDDEDDDDSGLS